MTKEYKIILSDKESKQGLQLYDILCNNKCVSTYSLKPLNKYVDIYEIEKNGFSVINSKVFEAIKEEARKWVN